MNHVSVSPTDGNGPTQGQSLDSLIFLALVFFTCGRPGDGSGTGSNTGLGAGLGTLEMVLSWICTSETLSLVGPTTLALLSGTAFVADCSCA